MPLMLGMEAAGVVEAVGEGVSHLKPGDRAAYASQPPGAYSELRVMPAKYVCRLPGRHLLRDRRRDDAQGPDGAVPAQEDACRPRACRPAISSSSMPPPAASDSLPANGPRHWACRLLIGTAGSDAKAGWHWRQRYDQLDQLRRENFAERVKEITGGKEREEWSTTRSARTTFEGSLACLRPFGLLAVFGNGSGPVPPVNLGLLAKGSFYLTRPTLFTHTSSRESRDRVDVGVGREQKTHGIGMGFLDPFEEFHAGHAGHSLIGHDQVHFLAGHDAPSTTRAFPARGSRGAAGP